MPSAEGDRDSGHCSQDSTLEEVSARPEAAGRKLRGLRRAANHQPCVCAAAAAGQVREREDANAVSLFRDFSSLQTGWSEMKPLGARPLGPSLGHTDGVTVGPAPSCF